MACLSEALDAVSGRRGEFLGQERPPRPRRKKGALASMRGCSNVASTFSARVIRLGRGHFGRPLRALDHPCDEGLLWNSGGGFQARPFAETVPAAQKSLKVAQAHTNGIESFWSLLKRGYYGTYHRMSVKHLQRYVDELSGRHNLRSLDTIDQMARVARGMDGKRLKYRDLVK